MTGGFQCSMYSILAALVLAAVAWGQQAADPYQEVLRYKFDQPRTAFAAIEAEIRAARPEQLRAVEAKLIAILKSPSATSDGKHWVCRLLRQIGSQESVPALAPLLADKELATVARWALQSIPSPKADEALRDALGRLQGDLRAGVIQTIGARGDRQAVPLLAPLAADKDAVVAEAALFALGIIGGPEALQALQAAAKDDRLKGPRQHAMLLCAERMLAEGKPAEAAGVYRGLYKEASDPVIRTAALRGTLLAEKAQAGPLVSEALRGEDARLRLAAAKFACELGGTEIIGPTLAQLLTLPKDAQLAILGMVNDRVALPAVLSAVKSGDEAVGRAALEALGRLGDGSHVPLLLGVASTEKGDAQAAARQSLQQLPGEAVDRALLAAAGQDPPAARSEAIRALGARGAVAAIPVLLAAAGSGSQDLRVESINALAVLADAKALPALVKLLVEATEPRVRDAAEKAIVAACRRIEDKAASAAPVLAALPGPSAEVRCALLRVLAGIPCAGAMEALRSAAGDAEGAVSDAAVRGLAAWPDAAAIAHLLEIARSGKTPAHKVLALRGVVRLAADRPAGQGVKILAQAMGLAARSEDKKLVLAALAEVNHPAALELAAGCLAQGELELEAAAAVVKIAKKVQRTDAAAAAAAIQKVLQVCKTAAARQLAEGALVLVGDMVNIAPQGTAASPDDLEKDGAASGDQAAIDGDPATYWDEVDGKNLYRLVVTFKQPEKIAAISILGYAHHSYAPKDFEVFCDGKAVKKVENAQYDDNFLVIRLEPLSASTVELKITGYHGQSPAIRELGIYRPAAPK